MSCRSLVAVLLLALPSLIGGACLPAPKTACRTSDDCADGRVCVAGNCQPRRLDAAIDTTVMGGSGGTGATDGSAGADDGVKDSSGATNDSAGNDGGAIRPDGTAAESGSPVGQDAPVVDSPAGYDTPRVRVDLLGDRTANEPLVLDGAPDTPAWSTFDANDSEAGPDSRTDVAPWDSPVPDAPLAPDGGAGRDSAGGTGGTTATGGAGAGGTIETGGVTASGGATGSGGAAGAAGTTTAGGSVGTGGESGAGGTTATGGSGGTGGGTSSTCQKGKVQAGEVVFMGDSLYSSIPPYIEGRIEDDARAAGALAASASYRNVAIAGQPMSAFTSQFGNAVAGGPVKVVIMDGGGVECGLSSCPSCPDTFRTLLAEMASHGVQDVIYTRYPDPGEPPGSDTAMKQNLDILMRALQTVCEGATALRCHWVDLRLVWQTGDSLDGYHPNQTGGKHCGDAIWAEMVKSCIAQ